MPGRLDGKVALVTGGASGIGLGSVELFLAEGARLVCADLQDEKGKVLEQRFPGRLAYVRCDVTREADIEAACAKAKSEFGALHALFNNAGAPGMLGAVTEITADGWNATFDLLVRGPALGMKHAVPLMLASGGGSIINTASIAGLQAGWGPIAYSTAKSAVIHMSRCAAAELSPQGIRVNAICPGLIATSIFGTAIGLPRAAADQMAARVAENAAAAQPVKKPGLPEDIARAALWLASDESAFVTGTHIVVDGGITVGGRHAWDPAAGSPFAQIFGMSNDEVQGALAARG